MEVLLYVQIYMYEHVHVVCTCSHIVHNKYGFKHEVFQAAEVLQHFLNQVQNALKYHNKSELK